MASDTYYKDMWLRRNRTALQVVIVLLSVIAIVLVIQTAYRGSAKPGDYMSGQGDNGGADKMVDTNHIRGRLFGDDEDDFDPDVEDLVEPNKDRVSDCCTIYDLWRHTAEDYECNPLTEIDAKLPPALVCFYPEDDADRKYKKVDPDTAKQILRQLEKGGDTYGFIDVGSGLGAYSFLSASLEHSVLSVEPNINDVYRFHKAAKLGRYERWITLLNNQVGASRDPVTIVQDKPQVKQILLDDLPAFCKFRKAIMRMNLAGHEHIAFQHAKFLFKEIQITFVYFEWDNLKELTDPESVLLVDDMIRYFNKRGYVPRGYDGRVLSIKKWQHWPNDIYWQKM